jgi:hypothetical protein
MFIHLVVIMIFFVALSLSIALRKSAQFGRFKNAKSQLLLSWLYIGASVSQLECGLQRCLFLSGAYFSFGMIIFADSFTVLLAR